MFASVLKCRVDNIDIKAVAREFAERNASRTAYLGKYCLWKEILSQHRIRH